jgi:hypothetical protein
MMMRQQNSAVPIICLTGELASESQGVVRESSLCCFLIKAYAKKQLLHVSDVCTLTCVAIRTRSHVVKHIMVYQRTGALLAV